MAISIWAQISLIAFGQVLMLIKVPGIFAGELGAGVLTHTHSGIGVMNDIQMPGSNNPKANNKASNRLSFPVQSGQGVGRLINSRSGRNLVVGATSDTAVGNDALKLAASALDHHKDSKIEHDNLSKNKDEKLHEKNTEYLKKMCELDKELIKVSSSTETITEAQLKNKFCTGENLRMFDAFLGIKEGEDHDVLHNIPKGPRTPLQDRTFYYKRMYHIHYANALTKKQQQQREGKHPGGIVLKLEKPSTDYVADYVRLCAGIGIDVSF